MTRAMRDRLAVGGKPRRAHTFATVRIRLPEGLLLQVSMWQAMRFCLGRHLWSCAGEMSGMPLPERLLLRVNAWRAFLAAFLLNCTLTADALGAAPAVQDCWRGLSCRQVWGQAATAQGMTHCHCGGVDATGVPAAGCLRQATILCLCQAGSWCCQVEVPWLS